MSGVFAGVWWLGSCSGGSLGVGFSLFAGYLGLARVIVWDGALRLDCYFSGVFLLVLAEFFFFCGGSGHWATILWSLDTFFIFRATCESACKYHVYK